MWSSTTRQINYGHTPEMGMVGLRDVFFVAPASSFHHTNLNEPGISEQMTGSNPAGATVGVIPVLAAGPASQIGASTDEDLMNRSRSSGLQFWQSQHSHDYMKKPMFLDQTTTANLLQSGGGGGGIGGSSSASTVTCQDCGNQAKKDCTYARCRACCKSRGFDCSTHVKSTWVPAARRRERQLMSGGGAAPPAGSSASTSGSKKPKLITSQTANSHTSTSTSSSHQDAGFKEGLPGEVRAPAVFRCVKVTAVEDGDDEYAYQGVVKISGHVFKGFLYDHGTEGREGYPNMSDLHLGGGGSGNNGGGNGGGGRNEAPVLDPSDVYAASGGGLFGGTSYGNPIN